MTAHLTFRVFGLPAPQGSKRGFVNKATGRVSMVESSPKVAPWRQDVKHAALAAHQETCGGNGLHFLKHEPVTVVVTFYLPRPSGHYGSGRNAGALKKSAPRFPATRPDLDKALRSTCDALGEAGIWADDSQVVHIDAMKQYADGVPPGALIEVSAA